VTIDTVRKAPTPDAIAKMMSDLLGVPTTTKVLSAAVPATALRIFGTYVDDANKLTWIGAMDVACAASTGAALAMMPIGPVHESIKGNTLTPAMIENSREVANVAANLFNTLSGHGHVRLKDYVVGPQPIPSTLQSLMAKPVLRVDLEVAVRGYPAGKLTLFRIVPYAS
jgi:hypothetical protein